MPQQGGEMVPNNSYLTQFPSAPTDMYRRELSEIGIIRHHLAPLLWHQPRRDIRAVEGTDPLLMLLPTDMYGMPQEDMMNMNQLNNPPGDIGQASQMAPPSINAIKPVVDQHLRIAGGLNESKSAVDLDVSTVGFRNGGGHDEHEPIEQSPGRHWSSFTDGPSIDQC
jgi:hypothetical protein